MSNVYLNHKFLKDNAKPGSWRRGYEVYQKNLVQDVKLTRNVLSAIVKGSYKDHYDVTLKFQKGQIIPSCTCPLKEEWCKHAIAVGLKVIEDKVYDEYLERVHKIKTEYPD